LDLGSQKQLLRPKLSGLLYAATVEASDFKFWYTALVQESGVVY